VRAAMHESNAALGATHSGCAATLESRDACELARDVANSDGFQRDLGRLVLSSIAGDPETPHKLWQPLAARLDAARKPTIDHDVLTQCSISRAAELFADRWGSVMSWPYADVEELSKHVQ